MANMSYCRFWNTKIDMDDCLNALWDGATLDGDELMVANVNPGVINDKEQNGLKFTNTSLISTENSATLTTSVENTTGSNIEVRVFNIIVKDKTNKTIATLQGYVGGEVPVGEKRDIVSHVDINLTEATNIEYQIIN